VKNLYLKNLDVKINLGDLIGIVGSNASGKTVLLKKIMGRIKNTDIYLDDKNINEYDIDFKKNNIVCVFDDNLYNCSNVYDELKYYLEKLNIFYEERINDFISYFMLNDIIDKDFIDLYTESRVYIKILSLLIINPLIICIDDLLTYLSLENKTKVLNYIKENNITLLNVTSNMEELLMVDKMLVLSKGEKVIFDKIENVLKDEDVFKENGFELPYIYELNSLLKSYQLINEEHVVYKELVNMLWK